MIVLAEYVLREAAILHQDYLDSIEELTEKYMDFLCEMVCEMKTVAELTLSWSGIRNAFLDQFSDSENRIDKWNIWENYREFLKEWLTEIHRTLRASPYDFYRLLAIFSSEE